MYEYRDPYILDFSNVKYYGEVHKIIKEALDFPDYYGENWDAFWDCLTDMVGRPINIEIYGLDIVGKKFKGEDKMLLDILEELRHWCDDEFINDISVKIIS